MTKAAIYIRVSTQEQAQEGYSVQAQKDRLINYCKAREWIISDIYIDPAYSGSNLDRPAIQQLIANVGKFDVVLVYKLDRLSRSQRDTLHLIEEVFIPANVDFVSMNESFDTGTPFGRAMIGILSVFAQLERETIKERTAMGKKERAKAGLFHGGPYLPIGYDRTSEGKLIINDYEAIQIKEIFKLYLTGLGGTAILSELNRKGYRHKNGKWKSSSVVLSVLDSVVYTGCITSKNDIVCENAHEAIIPIDIFEKVQKIRRRKKTFYPKAYKAKSLLQGFLYCGHCGARYFLRTGSKGYHRYYCYSRSKSNPIRVIDPNCMNKIWQVTELEKIVENRIRKLSLDTKYFDSLIKKKSEKTIIQNNDKTIKKQLSAVQRQIERLMDLYQIDSERMPIEEISSRIEKMYEEKKALEKQLSEQEPEPAVSDFDIEGIKNILKEVSIIWEIATLDQKRNIMQALIDKIELDGENVNITWSFAKK